MNKLKTFIRWVNESNTASNIVKLNQELFTSLLVFYLILLLVDNIWNGSVSSYLYLHNLLVIIITSGLIVLLTTEIKTDELKSVAHKISKNNTVTNIIKLNHELFSTLLVSYLILLLIENIWEASVSAHLNLNYLLLTTILSGVIAVLTISDDMAESESVETTTKEYIFILLAGLAGAVIIWYKTQDIGRISYIISIISGILIVMLSFIVLEDSDTNDTKSDMS